VPQIATKNKMQSETANFVPVPPPGELDDTYLNDTVRDLGPL